MFFVSKAKIKIGELKPTKKTDFAVGNDYLIDEIKKNGYNNEKSKILVDNDLNIIDGHHRAELIKKKYGDNKEIIVNKLSFPKVLFWGLFYIVFLVSPIFIFLSFLFNSISSFGINILKKYINGFKKSRSRNTGDIE